MVMYTVLLIHGKNIKRDFKSSLLLNTESLLHTNFMRIDYAHYK